MRTVIPASVCAAALAALPAIVRAEDPRAPAEAEWGSPIPDEPATSDKPPPPPADPTNSAVLDGQWVYTAQYGWVWMPYGSAYTYAPTNVAQPYMYVYGPAFGWAWVGAPWGWGSGPYFGVYGGFASVWGPGHGWWGWGHPRWFGRGVGPNVWRGTSPAPPRRGVFVGPRAGSGGTRGGFGGHRGGRR